MKILVLTSVYKDNSLGTKDKSTNVVNSFVKEWVKQGHEVVVIHNSHEYPIIIHKIPLFFRTKLSSYLNFQIADYESIKSKEYIDNGASIYRIPIKKYIPHNSPSKRKIILQVKKIDSILKNNNFIPDIITGHWASPQMEIIYYLKELYNARTALVLHGDGYINKRKFNIEKRIERIDKLGCRSLFQSIKVKNELKLNYTPFICYSGIPDEYLKNYKINLKKHSNVKKWKIVYVGRLIAYKNVDVIIKSLSKIKNNNWELNIVGDGPERKKLEIITKKLGLESKVNFLGRITRNEVMSVMQKNNIFVMASSNEVFGLVYLEAMASSCITIASKNGGVDGVIIDEFNGYLCEQKSIESLKNVFEKIMNNDNSKILELVKKAYNTVLNYSDSAVAKKYLQDILENSKND